MDSVADSYNNMGIQFRVSNILAHFFDYHSFWPAWKNLISVSTHYEDMIGTGMEKRRKTCHISSSYHNKKLTSIRQVCALHPPEGRRNQIRALLLPFSMANVIHMLGNLKSKETLQRYTLAVGLEGDS
jgi:hypothetical protein